MLEENYNHLDIEDKIYAFWESNKLFEPKKNYKKKYFSIVIPPPNVTGNLHMGHALNNSILFFCVGMIFQFITCNFQLFMMF